MILYHLLYDPQNPSVEISLREQGKKRILYLDTLRAIARPEDQKALAFLTQIHFRARRGALDTLSFDRITLPLKALQETLKELSSTRRLFFRGRALQVSSEKASLFWKGHSSGVSCAQLAAYCQLPLQVYPLEELQLLFSDAPYGILHEDTLYWLSTQIERKYLELFSQGPHVLEGKGLKRFLEEEPSVLWSTSTPEPVPVLPELRLRDVLGCFADLWMCYGKIGEVAFQDPIPFVQGTARQKSVEAAWEKDLLEAGFIRKIGLEGAYFCPTDQICSTIQLLLEVGWRVRDAKGRRVYRQTRWPVVCQDQPEGVLLSGTVEFEEGKECSLQEAWGAHQGKKRWVALGEGAVGWLDGHLFPNVEVRVTQEGVWVAKAEAQALNPLLSQTSVQWEESLRDLIEGLQEGALFTPSIPGEGFRGKLLSYQQKGVDWLCFLHRFHFSGLLADEMGLGKTVQVLAFFSLVRTKLPILIVAPTSLLFHWQAEIRKFLQQEAYIHRGVDRKRQATELQSYPFVITSYALAREDEALLSSVSWEVLVLDESQWVKNASGQTARALCRYSSSMRIALSGTPMENRKEELWSQFHFLLPHLLKEKKEFALLAPRQIQEKVRPFLLRRKKEEVALDLPEKMEQIVWVEMEEEQAELYFSYKQQLKEGLLEKIQAEGLQKHRMQALEAILRLRQIAIDPRLMGENVVGIKIQRVLEDLEELLEEGRKVLLYSQFTSMLELLQQELQRRGVVFCYLSGQTSAEKRQEQVEQFSQSAGPHVFLLSLKAGGVGLNLSAAEYVFLYDPWWNPFVEAQAIDRAHRLGQTKTVIARRYITAGSIEEKMFDLQGAKRRCFEEHLDFAAESLNWPEEDWFRLLL